MQKKHQNLFSKAFAMFLAMMAAVFAASAQNIKGYGCGCVGRTDHRRNSHCGGDENWHFHRRRRRIFRNSIT